MGTVGAIATIVGTSLSMIDKYIDDPTRRLKARQELIEKIKQEMENVLSQTEAEEMDKALLDFISSLHNL